MFKENFNIHDLLRFQLINENTAGLFKSMNPEYEFFKVDNEVAPDFRISVSKALPSVDDKRPLKYRFRKEYAFWKVEILEYENGFIDLTIIPCLKSVRKLFVYSALKNIYVRSLLYYCLIKKGYTLIHSSAVNVKDMAYIFVGRPGVFKTSIVMDLLRKPDVGFLGEENVLLKDGMIYPFPLNIQSLNHKIKKYKNEAAPSFVHKLILGLSLLQKRRIDIAISTPCHPRKCFYLEKRDEFECTKVKLENVIDKLILNEIQEIDITPTHTFSGISKNYFSDWLYEAGLMALMNEQLGNILVKNISNVDFYSVSMPGSYEPGIINEFLQA